MFTSFIYHLSSFSAFNCSARALLIGSFCFLLFIYLFTVRLSTLLCPLSSSLLRKRIVFPIAAFACEYLSVALFNTHCHFLLHLGHLALRDSGATFLRWPHSVLTDEHLALLAIDFKQWFTAIRKIPEMLSCLNFYRCSLFLIWFLFVCSFISLDKGFFFIVVLKECPQVSVQSGCCRGAECIR